MAIDLDRTITLTLSVHDATMLRSFLFDAFYSRSEVGAVDDENSRILADCAKGLYEDVREQISAQRELLDVVEIS